MAVYNTESFLEEAIDSVIDQTFADWELICVNDESTDNSLHLLRGYENNDPRIIVIDHPHCGNASSVRNIGLNIARGRYIAMLDSDDRIESEYLEKLVHRQLQTNADIVIASVNPWDHKVDGICKCLTGIDGDTSPIISGIDAFVLSLQWQIAGIGLHRSEALRKIRYCEIAMNGDEYTTRELLLNAQTVAFCKAEYFYRSNANSTTKRFSIDHYSCAITSARLLTLARNHNLDSNLYVRYKIGVYNSIFNQFSGYLSKRGTFDPKERLQALSYLRQAAGIALRELFLPALSVRLIVTVGYNLSNLLVKKIIRLTQRILGF